MGSLTSLVAVLSRCPSQEEGGGHWVATLPPEGPSDQTGPWQAPNLCPPCSASSSFLMQRDPGNEFLLKELSLSSRNSVCRINNGAESY